jgi:hypothetical protein
MCLFWFPLIPIIGLLALILSPSARRSHIVSYRKWWTFLGVVFFLLALIILRVLFSIPFEKGFFEMIFMSSTFLIAFVTHGIYFILLGINGIANENPKFYFVEKNPSLRNQKIGVNQNQQNLDDLLQNRQITEDEYTRFKKRQDEIEEKNREKEKQRKTADDNRRALKQLKSLHESGILTEDEYRVKVAELLQVDKMNGTHEGRDGGDEYSILVFILKIVLIFILLTLILSIVKWTR